jgi:hypothetical protein
MRRSIRGLGIRIIASEVLAVFLELARPVALLASMMSLLAVMHAAFFGSETDFQQRVYDSLAMLILAAGIALIAGMLFDREHNGAAGYGDVLAVLRTFPVRIFLWASGLMLALFVLARWIEVNCILSPEMRF